MLFNEEYKHEILRFLQKKGRNKKGGSVQDGRERGKRKTVFLEVCSGWGTNLVSFSLFSSFFSIFNYLAIASTLKKIYKT